MLLQPNLKISYATVAGGSLLIALVAGEAAHKFESMLPTDARLSKFYKLAGQIARAATFFRIKEVFTI